MNYKISFQERAKLGMEILSKQSPVTLEKARAQAERLSQASKSKVKKHFINDDLIRENLFNPVKDTQTITEDLFEQK
ncbi:hypothetical protein L1276_003041 [Flavobacterium sp. HSC-32F16]|uniref:hypothetical protein n=1 Tax=Flavobacterium sp. HSC-32F16 TaxID=2910964 RepID=UPI0020A32DA3|nr:hypothetical protein [Flavobacterium sp. HSC-32F16]MCP2027881.1 hypothetical protein [Flavobacterium sp. HSC-32F16]